MRLVIAGIAGGIVIFLWGFISHTLLPIGEIGIKTLPNEAPVIASMKTNITEPGFYFIPGVNMKNPTDEEQNAWTEKYKTGPTAILVYNPTGAEPMSPKQLLTELVSNILAAILVAFLLSLVVPSFSKRVGAAVLIGLVGWLSIMLSYWNWYRFPTNLVLAEGFDQVFSWFLAGLIIAFIIRPKESSS